ncbi:hypothetical protein GGP41_000332 [Bipolaris sorokiniana]|uniref:Uncharacterized protein n=1 Tax=Cochliobolus sativus TaxID=45130 RepID=A0A8H5ZGY8_COCSA|nr:hypothetical protein GGP41_000332 [Bipolaris sorokiniana]
MEKLASEIMIPESYHVRDGNTLTTRSLSLSVSLAPPPPPPPPPRLGRKLPHTMPRPILNTSHSPTVLESLAGPANGYRFHTGHKRELMDGPSLRVHS